MHRRWPQWLRRYAPAEVLALIGAFAGYLVLELATGTRAAAAYGAAVGDNIAYYGAIVARQARVEIHAARPDSAYGWLRLAVRTLRMVALEFGPAEALDSTIVRPACTTVATAALGPAAGVAVAKLAADVAFYALVVASYEVGLRRRSVVDISAEPRERLAVFAARIP